MSQGPQTVTITEVCKLSDKQIDPRVVKFANVTVSSENYVVVREDAQNSVAIVDLKSKSSPTRLPIPVDGAVMNPVSKVIAMRAQGALTLFSLDMKAKIKQCNFAHQIVFWNWINAKTVGIVTNDAVFHWSLEGNNEPAKIFDRTAYNGPVQIVNYQVSKDEKWCILNGLTVDEQKNFNGVLQVYSVEQNASQPTINAPAATFASVTLDGQASPANLFCFALKDPNTNTFSLKILQLGVPKTEAFTQTAQMRFADRDFPMSMIADPSIGVVYVLSQAGYLFAYEVQSGKPIYAFRASNQTIFTACQHGGNQGIICIDLQGAVMHVQIDKEKCVPYICNTMNDMDLGTAMARRYGLGGADHLFKAQFQQLMAQGRVDEASQLVASSPNGVLRNTETLNQLKTAGPTVLIAYFQRILNSPGGKLNETESVELAIPLLQKGQAGIDHITNWLKEGKLEASERLGDELRQHNPQIALSVYLRADAKEKVCMSFVQLGANEQNDAKAQEMFVNIIKYAQKKDFTPNYMQLLQAVVRFNSDRAKDFALVIINHQDGPKMDVNAVTDMFLSVGDVKNSTNLLLEYLRTRGDREEDSYLQTKLFESNLLRAPQVANAIFDSEEFKFTHYDRIRIAQMCEQSQLYQRALEHYTEANDIKRVLTNAAQMKPEFLLDFFGKLSPQLGLECLHALLQQSLQQNIRLVVEVAKKWTEHYGAEKLIALFEEFNSFNGLYFFLASFVNFTSNPTVVFKYIEAGVRVGTQAAKEVERVCRENEVYDPIQVKDFLLEQSFTLQDPRALIMVCDKHGYIEELIGFLFTNNLLQFIEAYVQRKSPKSAPDVLGALIDLNASQESIRKILDGLRAPSDDAGWVLRLSDVFEKRNRLPLLRNWLEARSQEGSADSSVYTALAKLYVDGNINPRHFLETNDKYDPLLVGKFCEQRDPTLAVVVYRKGRCDEQLIAVTTQNGFFKEQARYLVQRQSLEAWALVLAQDSPERRSLVDQVVSTALPESHSPEEVSCAVKAFMTADLLKELIELLDRLMLHGGSEHSHFRENQKLQNLLILTAVKVDPHRVMDYLKRLDNYDVEKVATVCLQPPHDLFEEGFFIYKKAKQHTNAVNVLLQQIKDFGRAVEYANYAELPEVWTLVGKAQLDSQLVIECMQSFLKAQDVQYYKNVIAAVAIAAKSAEEKQVVKLYSDLIVYLKMARKKSKDASIDNELVYAFAKTNKLSELEDFVQTTTTAKLVDCGDRCFNEALYHAAKIIYAHISNYAKLAKALVKLELWSEAVDSAKKAKSIDTWKFVCFACCTAQEFKLAQVCALHVIGIMEHLQELVQFYENLGFSSQLIAVLEAGINLERTHQGIFTALGVLYAKYQEDKLFEHLKLFATRSNIPQLITACRENLLWPECVFLQQQYEQFDNAIEIMISQQSASTAWKHELCKELLLKCSNAEIIYRCIDFYYYHHPLLLTDILLDTEKQIDPSRVIYKLKQYAHNSNNNISNTTNYALILKYLLHVQHADVAIVNDTLHEVFIEEENYAALRTSIEEHKQFDQIGLAQKLENHTVLEFRRIAATLYKQNGRYEKSIALSKSDQLYHDMMETCAVAKQQDLTVELLQFFVENGLHECFAAMLFTCYAVIPSDIVLELAWRHGLTNFVMPYMIQTFSTLNAKLGAMESKVTQLEQQQKVTDKVQKEQIEEKPQQDAIGLGLVPGAAGAGQQPLMIGYIPQQPMPQGGQGW